MRVLPFVALAAFAVALGCDSNDPFAPQPWDVSPDTTQLSSLDRPEYQGRPAAFDFVNRIPVIVESPGAAGNWDLALTEGPESLLFTPAGAFSGISSQAGVLVEDTTGFDDLKRAPRNVAEYTTAESVPVRTGVVYVVRTRQYAEFGQVCVRYAKMEVVEADPVAGTVRFRYVRNPNCNDRSFTSPD